MKGQPKRRALGKGLGSLIPEARGGDPLGAVVGSRAAGGEGGVTELPLDRIRPNPHQPRREFDAEELDSLAASIRASGILQPLLVCPEKDGGYTLVAGERRLRAAALAGLETVPAVIRDLPDSRLLEFALVENLQRDDLGPMETALAFRELVRGFGLTQAEVASRVGKPRSTVANYLRLLDLPREVQELLERGVLTMGHGRALAGLPRPEQQQRLAERAARRGWSVRETEQQVQQLVAPAGEGAVKKARRKDPNVAAAEEDLSRALEARVRIVQSARGRGRLEILFADGEDLDRLYRLLLSASTHSRSA
ncbi:MAG: ParB/RepB/Spo0J family partition protein [Acidobacteriota bacterium]|nr:ParB/RepB/Spo0J family partition protein [Acidobacteriota bacterium]